MSIKGGRADRRRALIEFLLIILLIIISPGSVAWGGEFAAPQPGRAWQFPSDHGAHPRFKTEWWYYTGHLLSRDGENFGYQLTFFRAGLRQPDLKARSAWALHTIYLAHLALSDKTSGTFYFREKANRGALGLAGAAPGRLRVWVDSWSAAMEGKVHHLKAQDEGLGLDLVCTPLTPPVLHGDSGFSRKAAQGQAASYYYSFPRMETRGRIRVGKRELEVTGSSWMDHEFFTHTLTAEQEGWDWFALQLDDGREVMLYLLRGKDGSIDPASSGTLIDSQGRARHLQLADFKMTSTSAWKSPHSKATYPGSWKLEIPVEGYSLRLTPTLADQEIRAGEAGDITYWEGQVQVEGQRGQKVVRGLGYAELTGYAGKLGGLF
ncbi:MAG: lipocalin-like domain-containing protein [Thermodesulfobacteriota bacterium]